ncbi:exocyst complex component EXO70B1-like protein [Tanacetum coccineum]
MAATTTMEEGQDRVLATAQQIVKSLNMNTQATEDMILILSRFDNRLSNITDLIETNNQQFDKAEEIILLKNDDVDSNEYLNAVDLIINMTENVHLHDRAENVLQVAMSRLEDDFRTVLVRSTVLLDAERLYGSVRSVSREFDENEGEGDGEGSSCVRHERGASLGGDLCFDLMSLDAVDELKDIADRMIKSGYEKECCQVYCNVRREVLDECLAVLGVERLSIEEVLRIDWKVLDEKLKKWILAVKVVVRVLLFGEKRLCEQVFNESELIQEVCFVETTKGCVMQLLNFGEAVAISQSVDTLSPIACRVQLLITSLESNIDEKSKLYEDSAMGYVFLMNNILYIVQKVKESELRSLLGDQWIRKHRGKIRQWHTSYLRAAWGKALLCLKDEGIGDRSSSASKVILKERFKSFNACFEDIYRIQTVWKVPDEQLREELRISISEKVLPAYRAFLGRFGSQLEGGRHGGKYIKYYPDDLENYLSDLFEGKPIVMNHMKRKNT